MSGVIVKELNCGDVVGGYPAKAVLSIDITSGIKHELGEFGVVIGFSGDGMYQSCEARYVGPCLKVVSTYPFGYVSTVASYVFASEHRHINNRKGWVAIPQNIPSTGTLAVLTSHSAIAMYFWRTGGWRSRRVSSTT